jgi:aldose 1-epimerase
MEPSHFPDSLHQPGFPGTVIEPGQPYVGKIIYAFGTEA